MFIQRYEAAGSTVNKGDLHKKPLRQPAESIKQHISGSNSEPMTPAKSQDGCKARRKRNKKTKHANRNQRQYMQSVTADGDTFSVGDSAYVMMTNSFDVDEFADVEVCQVCGDTGPEELTMLECTKCLEGYHLSCLTPPLTEVPAVCYGCISYQFMPTRMSLDIVWFVCNYG